MRTIAYNLLLAGIYFLLGVCALQLAIAPGYATAIFPAAGISFVAVLYRGFRQLPGVWLGAFGVSLWTGWSHAGLGTEVLLVAIIIASGSTFQAFGAAALVSRYLQDKWRNLDNDGDILRFLVLSGPLACLISATWGSSTLLLFKIISSNEWAYNWWNWWVGDVLGVLLFAPLGLMVLQRHMWRSRLLYVAAPTLAVTIAIIASFVYVSQSEATKLKQLVGDHGVAIKSQLQARISTYQEIVASLNNFAKATSKLDLASFEQFTEQSIEQHKDLQALSWNPVVMGSDRKPFEAAMVKEYGMQNFQITERHAQLLPAATRDHYVVVRYIRPLASNRKALGYDIASDQVRAAAINMAIKTRQPVITSPLRLVQENGTGVGVLLLHPTYSRQHGNEMPQGFAVGVFRVEEMLSNLLSMNLPPGLSFTLEDRDAPEGSRVLYRSGKFDDLQEFSWEDELKFGGRSWHILVAPSKEFITAHISLLAWIVLATGLLFACLLQAFLLSITGRASAFQRKLDLQTGQLRMAEQRWEFALEGAGDGVWDWEVQSGKVSFSKRWFEIQGFDESDIGSDISVWEQLLHPDDARAVNEALAAHFAGYTPQFASEHRVRCKNGDYKWILGRGIVVARDAQGKPLRAIGTHTDITERKLAELERVQLLTIIMESPDFIATSDMQAQLKFLNPAGAAMVGVSENTDPTTLKINDMHPAWAAQRVLEEGIPAVLNQGYWQSESALLNRQTGREIPVSQILLLHRDAEGVPQQLSTIMRDISSFKQAEAALRQSKEQFQAIQLSITESILLLDRQGLIISINPTGARRLGRAAEELVGCDMFSLFSAGVSGARRVMAEQVLSSLTPQTFEDERDGIVFSISCYPVINEQGECTAVVVVATDITERKLAEQALLQARTKAEAANRAKSEFLANMSHEIRTPMNAILGMAEILSESELNADQRKYVGVFQNAGNNLLELINDILDMSKVEAGQLVLDKADFSLEQTLKDLLDLHAIRAFSKGLELVLDIDQGVPEFVHGDAQRLKQCLTNLVGNAIKFSPAGLIVIAVRSLKEHMLQFSVIDNGIGIPADKHEAIFEAFSQADGSITRQFGGTGLGLTITRRLVNLMEGEIHVESQQGKGSSFIFSARMPAVIRVVRSAVDLGRLKILVADDHAINRIIVRRYLQPLGAEVWEADSAQQALALIAQAADKPFALVLLDSSVCELSTRSGADMIAQMRAQRLILLSSSETQTQQAKALGMEYLAKPIKRYELIQCIGLGLQVAQGNLPVQGLNILLAEDNPDNTLLIKVFLKQTAHRLDTVEDGLAALQKFAEGSYDLILMDEIRRGQCQFAGCPAPDF